MANAPLTAVGRFHLLSQALARRARNAGTYILSAAAVPAGVGNDAASLDAFVRDFASPLGFAGPDVGPDEWAHAAVSRADARERIVAALVGGAAIGHGRWDVPPAEAAAVAGAFLDLFGRDARCFCDNDPSGRAGSLAPMARPDFDDFIFGGGCVAVDHHLAAVLWVLDND